MAVLCRTTEFSTIRTFKSWSICRPTHARPRSTFRGQLDWPLLPSSNAFASSKPAAPSGATRRRSIRRRLRLGLLAFVAVRSDEAGAENRIAQSLAELEEVLEVHHVAGDDCYLIKVRARDAEHLGLLLRTRFSKVPGVRSTRTTIVLETVKETPRLPIAKREEARR